MRKNDHILSLKPEGTRKTSTAFWDLSRGEAQFLATNTLETHSFAYSHDAQAHCSDATKTKQHISANENVEDTFLMDATTTRMQSVLTEERRRNTLSWKRAHYRHFFV